MYRLNQRLHDFVMGEVLPTIDIQLRTRAGNTRKRDNVIQVTYARVARWLKTLDKLNSYHDVQAVGAAARGVFELFVDLRWFQQFPEPKYLDRFCEYPRVSRYMAAKKVVDHKDANPTSSIDTTPHRAFMAEMDSVANGTMADRVSDLWGTNGKGDPCWPTRHWTGEGDLYRRAKKISPDCADLYIQMYPMLCSLLHPGAAPEVDASLSDLTWLQKQVGYAHFCTFLNARAATTLTCILLDVDQHLVGFDNAMAQLTVWLEQAAKTLPHGPTA